MESDLGFELIPRKGASIEIVQEIPAHYTADRLPGSAGAMARADFANFLFWRYPGHGFEIYKNMYDAHRDGTVTGLIKKPVLELSCMYENSFEIDWKDIIKGRLPFGKIEMYYAPGAENDAHFKGGMRFTTLDIHFEESFLEPYAKDFPLMDAFLHKAKAGKDPARLFNAMQFLSPRMETIMREMMAYSVIDELAPKYYESYVHILLIHLLERLSGIHPLARKYSSSDMEYAIETKRILSMEKISDDDKSFTISGLSRRLHTTPYKLKTGFEKCYGMKIGAFKKQVVMEHAQQLLLKSDEKLDLVAWKLGYATAKSFGNAFKKYFTYTPGDFRKRNK